MANPRDITELFVSGSPGSAGNLDGLVPVLYDELRRVARAQLRRERADHSLQATALVHEVYLRLVNVDRMTVEGRAHFMALAARLMRRILVDHARRRRSAKRGGDLTIVGIEEAENAPAEKGVDLVALDDALNEMGTFDTRQRDVVEMKFFGGLTIDETAAALGVSAATVERDWVLAKAWLYRRLRA